MERLEQFCYTKKDFSFDWFSGTGAGGQHRNKHRNCLRLTHIPSGITVSATENRDRPSNIRAAFKRLKEQLRPWIKSQLYTYECKSTKVIRTYNVVDNFVKDHIMEEKDLFQNLDEFVERMIREKVAINDQEPEDLSP